MAAIVNSSQQHCVIKLAGSLGRACGRREWERYLESGTVNEVFSALRNSVPGFSEYVHAAAKRGVRYVIFRNGKNVGEEEFELGGTREIRIMPIIEGSKRGGVFQTIVGAVMIVAGAAINYFSGGTLSWLGNPLIAAGVANIAGGVAQMLSPQARGLKSRESPENMPSYAFGGPVNTTAAGHPVPLLYGRRRIGGAIISAGIHTEDIA